MCHPTIMESVRLSINDHLTSVGEEILCVLEKHGQNALQNGAADVCYMQLHIRVFVLERLRVAAQFMCSLFQREMETALHNSKVHTAAAEASPEHEERRSPGVVQEEPEHPQHEERSSSLVQEEPEPPQHEERSFSLLQEEPEPPQIKEELDEKADVSTLTRCSIQSDLLYLPVREEESDRILLQEEPKPPQIKEEQHKLLQRPEEADGSTMTLLAVKREDEDEDGETQPLDAYGSMLTLLTVKSDDDDENRETDLVANTSTAHVKTQADVEDRGAPQPTSSHRSESGDTEDSDDWEETREDQSSSNMLSQNLESSTPTRGRPRRKSCSCSVCGKVFGHMGTLRRHFQSHTGEKPFTCIVCAKGFGHKVDLKRHMTIHTGEKPFTCEVCGKGFGHVGDLKRHARTHTGEKPFTCTVCGKGLGRMFELTLHMRTHTGEKPFSCTVCGKSFRGTGNLAQHMRTHTGERPFTCAVCEQRFSLSTNLKRHMRTHSANAKKQRQSSSDGDPAKKKKTRTTTSELQGAPVDEAPDSASTASERPFYPAEALGCARTAPVGMTGPAELGLVTDPHEHSASSHASLH